METKRFSAIFLLILFCFESFWPTAAMALTHKGVQVDFASYEEVATTDMVNTITGDFTYNIPILEVPSPEGGFQMPLSYHAGIQMEEESSWVGLGWALNPGVVTRNVSIYPDDYDSTQIVSNYANIQSAAGEGWRTSFLWFNWAYDSEKGYSHGIQIGHMLGLSKSDASGIGGNILGVTKDENGWSFNLNNFAYGVQEVGLIIAGGAAGSAKGTGATLFNAGLTVVQAVDAYVAMKNSANHQANYSPQLQLEQSQKGFMVKEAKYNYWFEGSGANKALGVLYLGNFKTRANDYPMPHTNGLGQLVFNGPAGTWGGDSPSNQPKIMGNNGPCCTPVYSDYHTYYEPDQPLSYQFNPNSIAYDGFSVKAAGASGAISPFRLEPGTFAGSILSKYSLHKNYNLTSFYKNKTNTQATGYKVPFRYLGDPSNHYDYCLTTDVNEYVKTKFSTDWNQDNRNYFQVSLFDSKIYCDDLSSGSGRVGKESNRACADPAVTTEPIKDNQMVHRKHIAWYSNHEIINNQAPNFMNCGISRTGLPVNGIGGFSITREDGLTYHFSIPVYNKSEFRKFVKLPGPDVFTVTDNNMYATHWLLTGITGADFVDRGTSGQIDDADWGYWVRLDYGMYNNNFLWRMPYKGYEIGTDGTKSFSRGTKQTYYLNTIRTRSHTALFQKSIKYDGKSYYESDGNGADSGEPSDPITSSVSKSLKLDNIFILTNTEFDKLKVAPYNISKLTQDYNNALNLAGSTDNITANVVVDGDFNQTAWNYLFAKRLKGIQFNYSNDLCPYTRNSWQDSNPTPSDGAFGTYANQPYSGKLTLENITFWGPGLLSRFMPTYVFDYNKAYDNPYYSAAQVDDFGFFKQENSSYPIASGTVTKDNVGNAMPYCSSWSLRKITTPLGAEIKIDYERDTYSGVNGLSNGWYPMKVEMIKNPSTDLITNVGPGTWRINKHPRFGNLNLFLQNGNLGNIRALNFAAMSFNYIDFNFNVSAIDPLGNFFDFTSTDQNCTQANINTINGNPMSWARLILVTGLNANNPRYGGDLRVKQITTEDELGNKYATQYEYHNSGVASFETASTKIAEFESDKLFDHPRFPILYGRVTVSNGRMNGVNFETHSKTEYKFTTPHRDFLTVDRGTTFNGNTETNDSSPYNLGAYYSNYAMGNNNMNFGANGSKYKFRAKSGHIIIKDKTSKIGQIEQVTNYNSRNEIINQAKYTYTDGDGGIYDYLGTQTEWTMGKYGETNFIFELFDDPKLAKQSKTAANNNNFTYFDYTHRLIQTSKVKYPCVLKSYSINNGGVVATKNVTQWDYFTGNPIETEAYVGGPSAEPVTTRYTPAYSVYPEMGSKVMDPKNKNIMHVAAQEITRVNNYGIVGSKVTTWSNGVNYRLYDQPTGGYVSTPFPFTSGTQIGPYHPHKQYVWKSTVGTDGLIPPADFVDFNFASSSQDPRWVKTSEATLYSKYSKLLEGIDVNNKTVSTKYANNNSYQISTVTNCGYGEWCFSGAEEEPGTGNESNYFGSEVMETQFIYDSWNSTFAHTGHQCLRVPGGPWGNPGFHYKGSFGPSGDFKPNKKYRAAVWIHQSNLNAQLYVEERNSSSILNVTAVSIPPSSVKEKYGDWYRLNLEFTTPASIPGTNPHLLWGCWNNNSSATSIVYFDDFKVWPADAAFDVEVVNKKTGDVVAVLDEENIATRYFYDEVHKIKRVEKETKQGFKKMSEYNYGFKR